MQKHEMMSKLTNDMNQVANDIDNILENGNIIDEQVFILYHYGTIIHHKVQLAYQERCAIDINKRLGNLISKIESTNEI